MRLHELRRNPDRNPKIDLYAALTEFKDDPYALVHFTDIAKVGVHPRYRWDFTPMGIYGYPVASFLARPEPHIFGSDRDLATIFTFKPELRDRVLTSDYKNLADDLTKLRSIFNVRQDNHEMILSSVWKKTKNSAERILHITDEYASFVYSKGREGVNWNHVLRKLGYVGMIDYGEFWITSDIPYQGAAFTRDAITVVKTVRNYTRSERT